MVEIKRESPLYIALSTDTKATDVEVGAYCMETDTGKMFIFDESKTWKEI